MPRPLRRLVVGPFAPFSNETTVQVEMAFTSSHRGRWLGMLYAEPLLLAWHDDGAGGVRSEK